MKDSSDQQNKNEDGQNDSRCIFCQPDRLSFALMVKQALYKKYSNSQKLYYEKPINQIIGEQIQDQSCHYYDSNYLQYKQLGFFIDDVQNLKRFYLKQQYQHKMILFSQYFMEYEDFPRFHLQKIEKIMSNYKNAKRKYQYKKQLGFISSSSSSSNSQKQNSQVKKSKYSSILSKQKFTNIQQRAKTKISQTSDSYLLQQIVTQINQSKFTVNNKSLQFKGRFYFNEQHFDKFIEREEIKKKQKVKNSQKITKKSKQIKNKQMKKISQQKTSLQKIKLSKNTIKDKLKFVYENKQIRNKQFYPMQNVKEGILEENIFNISKKINQQENKIAYYNFLKKKPNLFENQTITSKTKQSPYGTIAKSVYQAKSGSKQKRKLLTSRKISHNTNSKIKLQKNNPINQFQKQQKLKIIYSDKKSVNQPILKIRSYSAQQIPSNKKNTIPINKKVNPVLKQGIVQQIINNKLTLFEKQYKIKL